jgi:hypothetical protein
MKKQDEESSGSGEDEINGSGEESGEDDDDIGFDFPRDNGQDLLQFLHRELNNLGDMEDG